MAEQNIKELSIQVSLNGLSFCILDRSQNKIDYLNTIQFSRKLSPFDVCNKLKGEFEINSIFNQEFDDVLIIHQNELATLVPAEFYNDALKADYLKFNSRILKTDFIAEDEIAINKSVNVYVPYVNINNFIYDTYGNFIYKHASSVFIDTVLQKYTEQTSNALYINVGHNAMECLVISNKVVQLYNYFDFETKEDFIYYILFVFEQLGLDNEEAELFLSGNISKEDDYFDMVYKYVRHVKLIDFLPGFELPSDAISSSLQKHFLILNSF